MKLQANLAELNLSTQKNEKKKQKVEAAKQDSDNVLDSNEEQSHQDLENSAKFEGSDDKRRLLINRDERKRQKKERKKQKKDKKRKRKEADLNDDAADIDNQQTLPAADDHSKMEVDAAASADPSQEIGKKRKRRFRKNADED